MSAPLTKAEAQIVRLLLDAYHNNGEMQFHKHTNGCECKICVAFEAAGNCKAGDFETLEEKVGWNVEETP